MSEEVSCSNLRDEINRQIKILKKFQTDSIYTTTYLQFIKTKGVFLNNCNTYTSPISNENTFWDASLKLENHFFHHVKPSDVPTTQDACQEKYVDISNMPDNQDQGVLKWCGCFSAADNLSFFLKEKLSAYDLCAQTNQDIISNTKQSISFLTGDLLRSIRVVIQNNKGLCLENDIKVTDNDWKKLSNEFALLNTEAIALTTGTCKSCTNTFDKVTFDIKKLLDKLSGNNKMLALIDVQCPNRINIDFQIRKNFEESLLVPSTQNFYEKIDAMISDKKPVYIESKIQHFIEFNILDPLHAMNIIGRKWNKKKNRCEYLIRNSWGKKCADFYRDNVQCVEGNGTFWISRELLFPAIQRAIDTSKLIEIKN